MQFVNLMGSASGTELSKSNDIQRLESRLESNIKNFVDYHTRKPLRYNNTHILSVICNNVSNYFETTPELTYEVVKKNLRYIANLFNVAYPGVKQLTRDVLMGQDSLVYKEFPITWSNGFVRNDVKCMGVYYHDKQSLRLADYIDTDGNDVSIIGLDIPLLAAVLHQEKLSKESQGDVLEIDEFITQKLICPLAYDLINIALLNRFELDSMDISYDGSETIYRSLPYRHDDTSGLYSKARRAYKDHFKSLARTQLSDLYVNLPLLNKGNELLEVKDYYMDSMMWLNAVSEVNTYNKLNSLNENYGLRLNVDSHENRLSKLLGRHKSANLLRHLEPDVRDYFSQIISR